MAVYLPGGVWRGEPLDREAGGEGSHRGPVTGQGTGGGQGNRQSRLIDLQIYKILNINKKS
jgi:hypothetical protein